MPKFQLAFSNGLITIEAETLEVAEQVRSGWLANFVTTEKIHLARQVICMVERGERLTPIHSTEVPESEEQDARTQ